MYNKETLSSLLEKVKLYDAFENHTSSVAEFRESLNGERNNPWLPKDAQREYRDLYRKCIDGYPETIITKHANIIQIDNYNGPSELWDVWVANGMLSKQDNLFADAIRFGYSYLAVIPGAREGKRFPIFAPMSPTNTLAIYGNDPNANFPEFVIQEYTDGFFVFIDNEYVYKFRGSKDNSVEELISATRHGFTYCPVVRIENKWTPKTQVPESPIARCIPKANALTDANFALELATARSSFKQKYGTGIKKPGAGEASPRPYSDSLLISDNPQAKFGTFDSADINQINASINMHLEQLAVLGEIPKYELGGSASTANMDSETLDAQQQGFLRAAENRKAAFAVEINRALRIAGEMLGIQTSVTDSVQFQTFTLGSPNSLADAIVKLISTGLSREKAYQMLPGVDSKEAHALSEDARRRESATASLALAEADSKRIELMTQRLVLYKELKEAGIEEATALEASGLVTKKQLGS